MKAVVKERQGKGQVSLRKKKVPRIGPDEVLIRTKLSSIGADVRIYRDDPAFRSVVYPPVTLGAENCGEIVEKGKDIRDWKIGDRVVSELYLGFCRNCIYCQTGNRVRCPQVRVLGRGWDGAYADYFKVPAECLQKIPDNVSFEQAVIAEDTSVCIQALLEHHLIQLNDTVAIFGPGPVGLLSLQLVRAQGVKKIVLAGTSRSRPRLELGEKLGADVTVDSEEGDLIKRMMDLTHGRGFDVVILATGSEKAINHAFEIISALGRIIVIGISSGSIRIPWDKVVSKSLSITGSQSANWRNWEKALDAISLGLVKVDPLLTHILPLSEWKEAFRVFESREGIKVGLSPEL